MNKLRAFFSWRLKLILALGCVGGLAVFAFGKHVESMTDLPVGPIPLSWKFKSNSSLVSAKFSGDNSKMAQVSAQVSLPEIDQVDHGEKELALFALG